MIHVLKVIQELSVLNPSRTGRAAWAAPAPPCSPHTPLSHYCTYAAPLCTLDGRKALLVPAEEASL